LVAWLRAFSIYQLIYLGLIVAMAPLLLALAIALLRVDDLATLSRYRVFDTQKLTMQARLVADHLSDLERAALQQRLLHDARSAAAYEAERAAFIAPLDAIAALRGHPQLLGIVGQMHQHEAEIHALIDDASDTAQSRSVASFAELYSLADGLLAAADRIVADEAEQVPAYAQDLQTRLAWQVGALLPISVFVAAWLFWVVSRPLRQVEAAIARLGRGEFAAPIAITGPRDLEEVGHRLDWLRARLEDLEAQKAAFLRNISHELKTPLTSIREGAELLCEDFADGSQEQREITQILRANSVRLQGLIDDLLRFSTEQWSPAPTERRRVALHDVVRHALNEHQLAMAKKQLRAETALSTCQVSGDAEQLHTVVDNLLSNAIRYSPPGGCIGIALGGDARNVVLDVTDQGPGIEAADRERIFDLFYQGKPAPHSAVKGTGMGLAIARQYVELHEGRISVVDCPKGAHLRVQLPRAGG
jgi:two-component system, NtrC family, sensor histidine kinase GlrK